RRRGIAQAARERILEQDERQVGGIGDAAEVLERHLGALAEGVDRGRKHEQRGGPALLCHPRNARRLEAAVGVDPVDDRQLQFLSRNLKHAALFIEGAGGDFGGMRIDGDGGEPLDRRHIAQVRAVRRLVDRQVIVERQQHGGDDAGGEVHRGILAAMNHPREVRHAIRARRHAGHTAGLAPGYVQGNVCILPAEYAEEFRAFCERNPKPCPLLAMSRPGDPRLPELGADLDIRTDVPRYRIFVDGELTGEVEDLQRHWRDDLVTFVLGCSFSFEEALMAAGLPLRYVEQGRNVPMYRTSVDTVPAGRFRGKLVVTMRPFKPADAIRAIEITSRYPRVHGSPVHLGRPDLIGIGDLAQPWVGDPTEVRDDEVPLFWACGVTPQSVVLDAKPSLCITHAPGHMLVTDLENRSLAER